MCKLSTEIKRVSGIYCIESKRNGKKYFGLSRNIRARIQRHFNDLELNRHKNQKLQRHFNKYGREDLEYYTVEICQDKKRLIELEIDYIKSNDSYKNGFNMTLGGEGQWGFGRRFKLKNISTGEMKEFLTITDASDFLGVHISTIHPVLTGRCNHCAGWCLPQNTGKRKDQKEFKLYHDEHGEYIGSNVSEFSRIYKLNTKVASSLLRGECPTYKGWRINKTKPHKKPSKIQSLFSLYHPEHGRYIGFSQREWANKFGGNAQNLGKLISGRILAYKGWTLQSP